MIDRPSSISEPVWRVRRTTLEPAVERAGDVAHRDELAHRALARSAALRSVVRTVLDATVEVDGDGERPLDPDPHAVVQRRGRGRA